MVDPVFSVRNLSVDYSVNDEQRPALRDLSFDLFPGQVLGIVGESGSGKSTVLFAAMRYLAENASIPAGTITLNDTDILSLTRPQLDRVRGGRIAMVYQDPTNALNPSMRIGDQIVEGVRRHQNSNAADARTIAIDWMGRVQLETPDLTFAKYPHELSGGQRQRVMIALALAMKPDVLLMDEPTTALDVVVQAHILDLVRQLAIDEGLALVFVTHDVAAVSRVADRILVLYAGEMMEQGPAEKVLHTPEHPYTRGLLAALPRVDRKAKTVAIPGTISGAPGRFSACVFADRCAHATSICQISRPPLSSRAQDSQIRCHFNDLALIAAFENLERETIREMEQTEALLELTDVDLEYVLKRGPIGSLMPWRPSHFRAAHNISFTLPQSRALAIVGESGSGKSTIARAILGLMPVASGAIYYKGHDVSQFSVASMRQYRQKVQIVFQQPTSSLNPRKRILGQVARPMLFGRPYPGRKPDGCGRNSVVGWAGSKFS